MGKTAAPNAASSASRDETDAWLLALLRALKARSYSFTAPTPASHSRVLARDPLRDAADLRDALGWSRPFRLGVLDPDIERVLIAARALEQHHDGRWKCRYRVSSLGNDLFLHSAYPMTDRDAVFFGPDSYRFADLIRRELARLKPPHASHLTDTNPVALRLATINAHAAEVAAETVHGPNLDGVCEPIDLALANPQYIIGSKGRGYCDGGGMHGGRVALRHDSRGIDPFGSRRTLHTLHRSAIIRGKDPLREALEALAARHHCNLRYHEIDPDVFGEELEKAAYADVDRIALVSGVFTHGPN